MVVSINVIINIYPISSQYFIVVYVIPYVLLSFHLAWGVDYPIIQPTGYNCDLNRFYTINFCS